MATFDVGNRVRLREIPVVADHPDILQSYDHDGPALDDTGTVQKVVPVVIGSDAGDEIFVVRWDRLGVSTIVYRDHVERIEDRRRVPRGDGLDR